MLSAIRRAGNTNHRAESAMRSPGTCLVVRRMPIALREKALAPSQRNARQNEQQQQIHQEIEDGLMLEPRRRKYLKKTCPCNGT